MLHTLSQTVRMLHVLSWIYDIHTTPDAAVIDCIIAWDLGGC